MHRIRPLFLITLLLAVPALAAAQQTPAVANPEGLQLDRAALQRLLEEYEQTAESGEYSGEMRDHARRTAQRIRARLENGDFQAGDRISLEVRFEPDLSGEFAVEPGRTITLPTVGAISLDGVLRSELQSHLEKELGQYLRNPVVQARALIRVAILGQVGNPGFYTLPASTILEDAIMTAGGPDGKADIDKLRVERAGETIWEDDALQTAMREGQTLDQLSLQAGDRIVVPEAHAGIFTWRGLYTGILAAGSLAFALSRIF